MYETIVDSPYRAGTGDRDFPGKRREKRKYPWALNKGLGKKSPTRQGEIRPFNGN